MTGAQQSPISNWPATGPVPTGPVPTGPVPTGPAPATAVPSPRKSPRRILLTVAIATALVAVAAVAGLVIASHPKGKLVLPATLLGLPKATSPSARHLASELKTAAESGTGGKLADVMVGVYGSPTGAWFAVTGGGICGTCSAKSASTQRHDLAAAGYPDATSFPAGARGGVLTCGSRTSPGDIGLRCTWVDGQTAGNVLFAGGAATSLADAAAKTIQVRTATER